MTQFGWKKLSVLLTAIWGLVCQVDAQVPQSVMLAWDRNPEPDIREYRLHIGRSSGNYDITLPVGLVTTYTVSDLIPGISYYFALTAVNQDGLESEYSSEVAFGAEADGSLTFQQRPSDFRVILEGNPETAYVIEASSDLLNWIAIATKSTDSTGVLTVAGHRSQQGTAQFFRAVKAQ